MTDDLTSILEGGWDALNEKNAQRANTANAHAEWETAARIAKPFVTREGKEALAMLRTRTLDNATWDPELGPNAVNHGFFREGQNSIVRWIEACIAKAAEGPPVTPDPERPLMPPKARGKRK